MLFGLPLAGFAQQTTVPADMVDRPLLEMALLEKKPKPVPALAVPAALKLLAEQKVVVLDVRTPEEFAAGHLSGARNVNFRAFDFQQQLAKLDPTARYVVYCASGNRSSQAAAAMLQQGFRQVANAGGYQDLKAAGAK
jgi:rhodanese-related sulfurtransferase